MKKEITPPAPTRREVFKTVVAWLKGQQVIRKDVDLCEPLQITKGRLSQLLSQNGSTQPSDGFIKRLEDAFLEKHNLRFKDFEKGNQIEYQSNEQAFQTMVNTRLNILQAQNELLLEEQRAVKVLITEQNKLIAALLRNKKPPIGG